MYFRNTAGNIIFKMFRIYATPTIGPAKKQREIRQKLA